MNAQDAQTVEVDEAQDDALGLRIARLSQPAEVEPVATHIWKQALEASHKDAPRRIKHALSLREARHSDVAARVTPSWQRRAAIGAIAAMIALAGGFVLMPSLGKARSSARVSSSYSTAETLTKMPAPATELQPMRDSARSLSSVPGFTLNQKSSSEPLATASPDVARMLVQEASIDIVSSDVRGLFARVQGLLRSDLGEYVQQSNLTGTNAQQPANPPRERDDHLLHAAPLSGSLVLRVRNERLQDTLTKLRALATANGEVRSENATASDVTDQAVDLDARIASEQRLESELLRLVETRGQLSELLELRTRLASVRESIERMQARRDALSRQVAFATITVTLIDAAEQSPASQNKSVWRDGLTTIGEAWHEGIDWLVGLLAFTLRLLVGGLPIWLIACAIYWLYRKFERHQRAREANEPAPFGAGSK